MFPDLLGEKIAKIFPHKIARKFTTFLLGF
jgi:hypothetical protein